MMLNILVCSDFSDPEAMWSAIAIDQSSVFQLDAGPFLSGWLGVH